jgi:hypothetical protein
MKSKTGILLISGLTCEMGGDEPLESSYIIPTIIQGERK